MAPTLQHALSHLLTLVVSLSILLVVPSSCRPQKSKKHKKGKDNKHKKGKIHNFEAMFCTLDQRLPSLVTGTWGANTFLVRKKLPNPHFQNTQTFTFLVFLTFSSNKRWWRLYSFSPMEMNMLAYLFWPFRTPAER